MSDQALVPAEVVWSEMEAPAMLIFAAGFEDRARTTIEKALSLRGSQVVVAQYAGDVTENAESFNLSRSLLESEHPEADVHLVEFSTSDATEYIRCLDRTLRDITLPDAGELWIDLSAFPMFGIAATLFVVRDVYPYRTVRVLYTEAAEYFPLKDEYERFVAKNAPGDLEMLEPAMTSEMSENLILAPFAGAGDAPKTCLLLYAGYEKHRSFGVIDQLNPHRLVFIFGKPGRADLSWRLEMSQRLHDTALHERPTARETVSTLDVGANVDLLMRYYELLYDDHDLAVAPVCSKMQTAAAFLFWEHYRDVQLVFPLPIEYLPKRFSKGVGHTYSLLLPYPPGIEAFLVRGEYSAEPRIGA